MPGWELLAAGLLGNGAPPAALAPDAGWQWPFMIFVEAPTSEKEIADIAQRLPGYKLINMFHGGKTPLLPASACGGRRGQRSPISSNTAPLMAASAGR